MRVYMLLLMDLSEYEKIFFLDPIPNFCEIMHRVLPRKCGVVGASGHHVYI